MADIISSIITLALAGIEIYTCIRIIRYINMREDEAYEKAIYQQAKRDLQDINEQLKETTTSRE